MELLTIIEKKWNPKTGLAVTVRKGTLTRDLSIPPSNKYDVWGYGPPNRRTGKPKLLLRGDARRDKDEWPFVMERGRHIKIKIADYLKDFEIVC